MPDYHKLYTPQDSAVVFIDHQPQMTFGVANIDRWKQPWGVKGAYEGSGPGVVLDLDEVTLADVDVVCFTGACKVEGNSIHHGPP